MRGWCNTFHSENMRSSLSLHLMKHLLLLMLSFWGLFQSGRAANTDTAFITPFERSNGRQTATFVEAIEYYKKLSTTYNTVMLGDAGITDNGYPLKVVYYTKDGKFTKDDWKKNNRVVIMINNDIHPGEPDGVDASMMLVRDAATGKIDVPANIVLVVIPVYNIGGALNRNSNSRANQNGPESYGFRGNAKNLDLNRDFTKCDAAETISLEELFARTSPDIFIDNHVSDGADYQHIMTLLASQHDKLGGAAGEYMYKSFTPLLYKEMKTKGYDMVPYVNDFDKTPETGWTAFFESPRYSSGYASLFGILAYVPETHMLKPFKDRVNATYALMECFIKLGAEHAAEIKTVRAADRKAVISKKEFALDWKVDTTRCDSILFMGYEAGYKPSDVSGLPRLYYDHNKPFTKKIPFYDHFIPTKTITKPQAYIIPKAWASVISILRTNGVHINRIARDTTFDVTAYHIDNYETLPRPYEKHYMHKNVQTSLLKISMRFTSSGSISRPTDTSLKLWNPLPPMRSLPGTTLMAYFSKKRATAITFLTT
jgi:Zinc carboxypeptidase